MTSFYEAQVVEQLREAGCSLEVNHQLPGLPFRADVAVTGLGERLVAAAAAGRGAMQCAGNAGGKGVVVVLEMDGPHHFTRNDGCVRFCW